VDGRVRLAVHATSGLVTAGPRRVELDVAVRQEASRALDALIPLCPAGEILVSRPAARFLERRFDMSPVAAGIDAQRLGHRASSPAVPARARPFVGRDHELALLRSRFDLAAEGHGQLVGIMGEAGLGKSRLVRELADGVAGDGIRHLEGHCLPFTGSVPYFPVVDIVRGACGLTEMDDATVAAERVGAALTEAGMPLAEAPSLLHMLGFKPDAPERELDTPELVRERTFEAVRQLLLRQSRRRPLLLVIEDVHWIDETSGALLASLAEMTSQSRILLVETYRPGYRPAAIDRSYATQITLSALSLSDSRRILDGILPGRPFARSVTDMVLAKAEGNPFFLEELARHVVDRGDGGGLDDIPDTVHAVLAARLDHLEPVARNVLLTAAVVGRSVPRSVLTAVAGLDESAIAAALRHLGTTEFLVENTFGPDATYAFKHALIHDVAYATLPPDRRRELHGRVLDAMEDLFGDRLSEHRARLAHHAFRGERWAAAARYLRDAGVEAAAASASREAIVLFEQALVALSHLPQDPATLALGVDVRVELRNALWTIAQLRRGLACLHEAEPLAAALGDRRRQARLSVHMATNCLVLGDNAGAGAAAHRTLALATELGHAGLTIDARQFLGFLYTSLGDYRRAAEYLEANLAALGGGGGRFEAYYAVHGRTWLVWALVELGRFDDADARAAEARTLAEASRQPHNLIASQWATGYIELGRGRPSEGVPALERAATLTAEWDIALWRRPCAALLGHAHALAGRLDVALPLLESVLGADENNVALALWTAYLADACLRAGQLGRARKIADDALALARAGAERGHEAHALAVLAAIDAAAHDARAPGRWGEALALAESLEMAPLAARCRAGFAAAATEGSRPC
jgi:tetratricopeptide (TPR) repeat protein